MRDTGLARGFAGLYDDEKREIIGWIERVEMTMKGGAEVANRREMEEGKRETELEERSQEGGTNGGGQSSNIDRGTPEVMPITAAATLAGHTLEEQVFTVSRPRVMAAQRSLLRRDDAIPTIRGGGSGTR